MYKSTVLVFNRKWINSGPFIDQCLEWLCYEEFVKYAFEGILSLDNQWQWTGWYAYVSEVIEEHIKAEYGQIQDTLAVTSATMAGMATYMQWVKQTYGRFPFPPEHYAVMAVECNDTDVVVYFENRIGVMYEPPDRCCD